MTITVFQRQKKNVLTKTNGRNDYNGSNAKVREMYVFIKAFGITRF